MSNQSSASGGIGFIGALTILFVALKLLEKIDWSWWWVLSPLWIPMALVLALVAVGGILYLLSSFLIAKEIRKACKRNL